MPRTVVLETFQTYHAIFRAVNPFPRSTGAFIRRGGEQTRDMPLSGPSHLNPRTKAPRAFNLVKELALEVPRFPLTCRGTLSPTSSPVARAAITKLHVLDARFFCRTQITPASAGDNNASC